MFYFPSSSADQKRMQRLRDRGDVRRVAPGVYIDAEADFGRAFAEQMPAVLRAVVGDTARLSHRSALSPTPYDDVLCMVDPGRSQATTRAIDGKTILILNGMDDPTERTLDWGKDQLRLSSLEMALVECVEERRGQYRDALLAPDELEEAIYNCREDLRPERIAELVERRSNMPKRARELPDRVRAIQQGNVEEVASPRVRRKLSVRGADDDRVQLFGQLAQHFREVPDPDTQTAPKRPWSAEDPEQWRRFAFLASYFSNYVEGTRFPPEQAQQIIRRGASPVEPPDERTLVATFRTYEELRDRPEPPLDSYGTFASWLKRLHEDIAGGNESLRPGVFKEEPNEAGSYRFVQPERVEATLEAGLAEAEGIDPPLYRTFHLFFVVNEVHPFRDGNGRVARALQDCMLIKHGYSGLLVTSKTRDFYLDMLRSTSLKQTAEWTGTYRLGMLRLYRRYCDLPLRSEGDTLDFARDESDERGDPRGLLEQMTDAEDTI